MDLTNEQWAVLAPILPKPRVRKDGRGRPWRDPRDVLNGVLWVLRTGAPWHDLPTRYPSYQTCHRRFQKWVADGVMEKILRALAEDMFQRGKIDTSEAFLDASFASAKKGVISLVRQSAERGPRLWLSQTALVFLSPYPLQVLHRMKPHLLNRLSTARS